MLATARRQGSLHTHDELQVGLAGVIADDDAANARWPADHRHHIQSSSRASTARRVARRGRRRRAAARRRRRAARSSATSPPSSDSSTIRATPARSPAKLRGVGVNPKMGGVAYIERDEDTRIAMAITRANEMDEWQRGGGDARAARGRRRGRGRARAARAAAATRAGSRTTTKARAGLPAAGGAVRATAAPRRRAYRWHACSTFREEILLHQVFVKSPRRAAGGI